MPRGGSVERNGKIVKTAVAGEEKPLSCLLSEFKVVGWVRDGLFVLMACIGGAAFGSLLSADGIIPQHPETGISEIFGHNFFIALIVGFLTYYAALPVFAFNAFFLGINLCLFTRVAGLSELLSLSVLHVPLEMLAWLLTLSMSRRITGFYRRLGSEFFGGNRSWRQSGHKIDRIKAFTASVGRSVTLVAVTYGAAAVAEYYELKVYLER